MLLLATLALAAVAKAVPCVQFDTSWNLYAFGGTSDVKLGQNTTWGSPSPTMLSTSGRPPWTGNSSQCLLSQYNNAMFVLGADQSDLSKIYVYSFASDAWSTQSTTGAPSNLGNSRSASVLDHDTNVLFTLPYGASESLYQLDLSKVTTTASSSAIAWTSVENPGFSTSGYMPTAAQASNHINYFGAPSSTAGSANLFVVHFSYFQPDAQSYPTVSNGAAFPDTAGQAFSIPNAANSVPLQMVFVPNDFSNSYVVSHWTDPGNYATTSDAPFAQNLINSTQLLPPPTSKDSQASYAASDTAIVQIDSAGDLYYITSAVQASYDVSASPSWTKMSYSLAGTGGTVSSSNSTNSTTASSSTSNNMTSPSGSSSSSSMTASAAAMASGGSSTSSTGSTAAGSAAAGSTAAASSTSKSSAGRMAAKDAVGLLLGVVMVGVAVL